MAEQESILRIKIDSRNAEKNANSLNKELQSIEKNGDFASKSMDSMSVATRQLAVYMAGIVTVGAAINKMDLYTNLNNRLKLVTTNQTDLNTALNDTFAIAQKSYQAWDSVVQVYQRFSDNAKTLGINMQQTAQLTETVSKAVAISGASTQAAEAALTQFGQALASGTLRGEELNSILEQTPALAKAIAQGMGITVGQLRSVAAEGKITGDVLVKALTKSKKSVDELFNRTDITIGQSITLLSNEITKFTGEAGKASGAASFMAEAIKTLSQNLDLIANIAIVGGVALLTKAIATQTAAVYESIGATIKKREADALAIQSQIQLAGLELQRTRQVQALALTELNLARQELNSATTRQARAAATMRLTQAEIAHNIAIKQTTASTAALNVVESQLNKTRSLGAGALALVGGPIGAITLGVTALSAAYMLFSDSTKESTESLRENNESVSDAIAKYKELTLAKQQSQAVAEKEKLSELGDEYSDLSDKLNTATYAFSRNNDMTREQSIQVNALVAEYKKTNDLEQFSKKVNALTFISEESKNKFNTLAGSVKDAGDKFREQRTFIEQMNTVLNNTKSAGDNAAAGIRNAAAALTEINTKLSGDVFAAKLQNAYEKQGKSAQNAARWTQVQLDNAKKGFNGVTVAQKKMLDELDAVDKQREARQQAITSANKAATSSAKAAASQAKKDTKDQKRLAEEQYNMRESIAYNYADRIKKIELDLQRNIADIQKANFSPKDTAGLIEVAKNRSKLEKDLYVAQLAEEYSAWGLSEERKLELRKNVNDIALSLNGDLTDDMKAQAQQSLDDQYAYELANIKLAKEQRIFQAEQAFLSETDMIRRKYELERQEIELNKSLSPEERSARTRASYRQQSIDENAKREQVWDEYQKMNGIEKSPYQQDMDLLDEALKHNLILEEQYQQQRLGLQLSYGAQYASNFTGLMMGLVDSNSSAYRAMAAAQKGFALYSVLMDNQVALSKAWASAAFPYNLPAVGAVLANNGILTAAVQALNPTGFQSGGYTGNGGVSEIAGVVHGKEYVLNAEATKRVGVGTLNAINAGADLNATRQAKANAVHNNVNVQPQNIAVNNILDPAIVGDYMSTQAGTKTVMNLIKNNRTAIKATIG